MLIPILYAIWIAYTAGTLAFFLGVFGIGVLGCREQQKRLNSIRNKIDSDF